MPVKKILHVIPSVGRLRGGPSAMVRSLARRLSQAGLEPHIATTNDNGPEQLQVPCGVPLMEDGVRYWYFPRQTRFYIFSWPLSSWLARHVREFDLVHIHALFSFAAVPAAFWARRYGVPYIVRPLGTLNEWGMKNRRPWLKKVSFQILENRILEHAEFIHYTSEQERTEAVRLGVTRRSVVISNPVEPPPWSRERLAGEFRSRHPELADRRIILFLSRIDRKKGLDLLLSAVDRTRAAHPDARLVIAGSGDPELVQSVQRQAGQMNLGADVAWVGFLEGREKWAALADADVFVLPSYSENFGIAAVEALVMGTPVVVSDQVAVHREISRAGAGLVVQCCPEAVTNALIQILSSPMLSMKLSQHARALAHERFSVDAVITRLLDAYETVGKGCLPLCQPQSTSADR